MNRSFAFLPALALAGCGHVAAPSAEPILAPLVVDKPTSVGCVPANLASPPVYPDTDAALQAAPDGPHRYQLEHAGRKLRVERLNELEPIVATCPKATAK